MTVVILAAGSSIPFGDFPKQLLDVGGETLLERQVRQFGSATKIYLATHRKELNHPRCIKFDPPSREWKCDTLLSSRSLWNETDKTIVIHGDVYFTDAACETVGNCPGYPLTFFWNGGVEGTEAYGLCFVPQEKPGLLLAIFIAVEEAWNNHSPPHDCGLMKLMATCEAIGLQHEKIILNDGTRDFDNPDKHRDWKKGMGFP